MNHLLYTFQISVVLVQITIAYNILLIQSVVIKKNLIQVTSNLFWATFKIYEICTIEDMLSETNICHLFVSDLIDMDINKPG